jgi:hypothetical protein
MVEIRLRRAQNRKENKKPSIVKPDTFDSIAEKFIDTLLRRRVVTSACSHYLIGGSNLYSFMLGTYNMKKAHAMFHTKAENKVAGQAGEESFLRSQSNIKIKHPFGILKSIPWLCATGDYVINEFGRTTIVEIKTFNDFNRANYFYNNVDHRAVMQLWVQMDVFGANFGKIVVYYLDRISKIIFQIGIINFERQVTVFSKQLIILSAIRYSDFLKEYFDRIKIYPSDNYFKILNLRLACNGINSAINEKETGDNDYIRTIKRGLLETCQYMEDNSFDTEFAQNKAFIKYDQMFIHHKFVNRSRVSKIVVLDEEYRRLFVDGILNKISNITRESLHKIENELNFSSSIKNFVSNSKLKHAKFLSESKKKAEIPSQQGQQNKYSFAIEKLRAKIKTLQQENKRLKHAITNNGRKFEQQEDLSKTQTKVYDPSQTGSIRTNMKLNMQFMDQSNASIKTIRKKLRI